MYEDHPIHRTGGSTRARRRVNPNPNPNPNPDCRLINLFIVPEGQPERGGVSRNEAQGATEKQLLPSGFRVRVNPNPTLTLSEAQGAAETQLHPSGLRGDRAA